MALEQDQANEIRDLRLQFFATVKPVVIEASERTYLVEVQNESIAELALQPPAVVQCNCACK